MLLEDHLPGAQRAGEPFRRTPRLRPANQTWAEAHSEPDSGSALCFLSLFRQGNWLSQEPHVIFI